MTTETGTHTPGDSPYLVAAERMPLVSPPTWRSMPPHLKRNLANRLKVIGDRVVAAYRKAMTQ